MSLVLPATLVFVRIKVWRHPRRLNVVLDDNPALRGRVVDVDPNVALQHGVLLHQNVCGSAADNDATIRFDSVSPKDDETVERPSKASAWCWVNRRA